MAAPMHRPEGRTGTALAALWMLLGCVLVGGCRQDMHDNPRFEPLEGTEFFADGRASRPQVPGTIARGELVTDPGFVTGRRDGVLMTGFPLPVDRELLERGRERYDIFCSVCHDRLGTGNGMVVQRGFLRPPTLHDDRLRGMPNGHFFDVMTHGYGAMFDYADRIDPADRWAIVAWIRVLQRSQHASIEDAPVAERARLNEELGR